MKTKQDFEKWLCDTAGDLISLCGLGSINLKFCERKDEPEPKIGRGTVVFSISYDKSYKTAYLEYHPVALRFYSQGRIHDLMDALSHEVCHIFTFPIYQLALNRFSPEKSIQEANEQLTEEVAVLVRQIINVKRPDLLTLKGRDSKIKKHK